MKPLVMTVYLEIQRVCVLKHYPNLIKYLYNTKLSVEILYIYMYYTYCPTNISVFLYELQM